MIDKFTKMKCTLTLEQLTAHSSYTRQQLLKEVFEYKTAGSIKNVWNCAGHLFVALSGVKQLVTFDARCLDTAQESEHINCLDLEETVVQVISKPPDAVFVVLADGCIQYWSYKPDSKWTCHCSLRLTSAKPVKASDVCYSVSQNAFYWCEQEVREDHGKTTYSINKRILSEDNVKSGLKLTPVSTLVTGCPECRLYPSGHGVLAVSSNKVGNVSMAFSLCTLTGTVRLIVDNQSASLPGLTVHSPLSFRHIVLKSLQYMKKLQGERIMEQSYVPHTQTVLLLLESGRLVTVQSTVDTTVETITLADFQASGLMAMFLEFSHVCLLYPDCIRCYSRLSGDHVADIEAPMACPYQGLSEVLLGGLQHYVYTGEEIYVVKKTGVEGRETEMNLLQYGHFQSDAVRLSYVDKMQKYSSQCTKNLSMDVHREKWLQNLGTPPTSKLVETVEPYLSEYWRLETMLRDGLQQPENLGMMEACTVETEVARLLDPKSGMSRPARQSQLALLALKFPNSVIDALMSYLNITEDELSTSQQQRWLCAITGESCAVGSSCDIAVPLFELMTHLLHKHRPSLLLSFLRCAQSVSDRKVGISAFARRRQALVMYERALQCFPDPHLSCDKEMAIQVHTHVLLMWRQTAFPLESAVEGENHKMCATRYYESGEHLLTVVHMLVRYQCWNQCVELLQEYRDKTSQFPLLYQVIFTALTENGVIGQYGDKVFSLMPAMSSVSNVLAPAKEKTDILLPSLMRQEGDVSVDMVRSHLLQSIQKQNNP